MCCFTGSAARKQSWSAAHARAARWNAATVSSAIAHLLPIVSTIPQSHTGSLPFGEHLRRVRGTLLDAFQHQDYPFARLLNKLDVKRDISRSPLISTIFNIERPAYESSEGGLKIARHERHVNFARMDFTLTVNLDDGGIVLECAYNTDLFDAATIDRMLIHYKTLLDGVVENPDADLHTLPLLDETMRHQQLRGWNESEPHSVERCVHQLFESQVERQPDAISICERWPAGIQSVLSRIERSRQPIGALLGPIGSRPGTTRWRLCPAVGRSFCRFARHTKGRRGSCPDGPGVSRRAFGADTRRRSNRDAADARRAVGPITDSACCRLLSRSGR